MKSHIMTLQRWQYAVGAVFCRVLAVFGYSATSASRVVLLPRTSASRVPRRHHEAPRGHYVYARGSRFSGNPPQFESFAIGGALQDAVRKDSPVQAAREDGLYVDTLQALSRFRLPDAGGSTGCTCS